MKNLLNLLTSAALSFTVSGNTGIAPFLSLFMMGAIEKARPDVLNMGEGLESLFSSWISLSILGILAVLESVGHCIPVVDEVMDSILTFIIPVMSVLGSFSTFGVLQIEDDESDDNFRRELSFEGLAFGALVSFRVVVIIIGIGLALSMHLFKMLVRLAGEGWLTQLLTVGEISFVVITILLATYIRPLAIATGGIILFASIYSFKRRYWDRRKEKDNIGNEADTDAEENLGGDYINVAEVEASKH